MKASTSPDTYQDLQYRQSFLDSLTSTQEWLNKKGIEYRIIGSVAASAYLDPAGHSSLNFNRPGARSMAERVPDIDLIVPRGDLPEARKYRDRLTDIKLGLALPTRYIDFRPEDETSYLTHNNRAFPFKTTVLDASHQELLGVPITTLSPAALVNTYFTIRERDRSKVKGLSNAAKHQSTGANKPQDYLPFQEFREDLVSNSSLLEVSVDTTVKMLESLPPPIRTRAFRCALVLANLAHLR